MNGHMNKLKNEWIESHTKNKTTKIVIPHDVFHAYLLQMYPLDKYYSYTRP